MAELAVDALKALVWPALLFLGAVVFFSPLTQIVRGLANKLDDANKVSIAGFSLEVEAKVRQATNSELAEKVGNLSPGAIEHLMRTSANSGVHLLSVMSDTNEALVGLPKPNVIDALTELESKGFITFKKPIKPFLEQVKSLSIDEKRSKSSAQHIWYLVPAGEASLEYRTLSSQGYQLTDQGKAGSNAIIKAVSELISRKAV